VRNDGTPRQVAERQERLTDKKPGLFLVEDHSGADTVWLDLRDDGEPDFYGYSSDADAGKTTVHDLKQTRDVKMVLAASRAKGCAKLSNFVGAGSD
jgi:hypothetical protein